MKRLLTILAVVAVLAVALWVPAHAGMVAVGDSDLAAITGKNQVTGSTSPLNQIADGGNGNIQVGAFQWEDSHTTDGSNQKAANYFGSDANSNQAQQNVVGVINEINWGAAANSATNVGTLSATSVDIETWGTLYIGGF